MDLNIIDQPTINFSNTHRWSLLPNWVKFFTWVFLFFGLMAPVQLILAVFDINLNMSIYGLEMMLPLSLIDLSILFLFQLKGIVAYGFHQETDWAVDIAIIDGVIGSIICIFIMLVLPFIEEQNEMNGIRLELIPVALYLIKMIQIRKDWNERKV